MKSLIKLTFGLAVASGMVVAGFFVVAGFVFNEGEAVTLGSMGLMLLAGGTLLATTKKKAA